MFCRPQMAMRFESCAACWCCRYYDGALVSDDEMAAAGECRDVVLCPPPADAPAGVMPMAAIAAAAAAAAGARSAGGSNTVLLSRVYGEDKVYTQVSAVEQYDRLRTTAVGHQLLLKVGGPHAHSRS